MFNRDLENENIHESLNLAKAIHNTIKAFQANPTEENFRKVNDLTKKLVNVS